MDTSSHNTLNEKSFEQKMGRQRVTNIFLFFSFLSHSCSMYFLPFAQQNPAEVWPIFQSFLKLLLWINGVKLRNAMYPLCLFSNVFFGRDRDEYYNDQNKEHLIDLVIKWIWYTAQCVLCKVYFSAQLNKLRPILKFKKYYPIEHIFVPACSSARKIHFFKF